MQKFTLDTQSRNQWLDITHRIDEEIQAAGIETGACLVLIPHTTAGITVNEDADPDVRSDALRFLGDLIPQDWGFRHGEGNSDAHIKASLMGCSTLLPIEGGKLALGRWQGVYFCEFDGPRHREVRLQFLA